MPLEKRGAALGGPFAFRRQRAGVGAAMLEIASDKVAHIIIKARKYDVAQTRSATRSSPQ
jgi:hypothetical protein